MVWPKKSINKKVSPQNVTIKLPKDLKEKKKKKSQTRKLKSKKKNKKQRYGGLGPHSVGVLHTSVGPGDIIMHSKK